MIPDRPRQELEQAPESAGALRRKDMSREGTLDPADEAVDPHGEWRIVVVLVLQRLRPAEFPAAGARQHAADMVEADAGRRHARHDVVAVHEAIGDVPELGVIGGAELVAAGARHAEREPHHGAGIVDGKIGGFGGEPANALGS
jgi:hypothetical protein